MDPMVTGPGEVASGSALEAADLREPFQAASGEGQASEPRLGLPGQEKAPEGFRSMP